MPSKHTFSATTDCMISERCSEITSCHLSAGPGLLMFTRSNLAPTQVPTSKQPRAATSECNPKHDNPMAHASVAAEGQQPAQLKYAQCEVVLLATGS